MEVFCLASGPSLTAEDAALVKDWRSEGRQVFVVNNTWQMAPWADLLFVGDGKWLEFYGADVTFPGRRVTASTAGHARKWEVIPPGFQWFENSGVGAIAWAIREGARRVFLLGYDCQRQGEKSHWHGSHVGKLKDGRVLKDATNIREWPTAFAQVATLAKSHGVEVFNCTRATALKCFPRVSLESVVEPSPVAA